MMAMPDYVNADLLFNVFALDDVTSREPYHRAEDDGTSVRLIETAVRQLAEAYFDGKRHDGPEYADWNGSRLQFWVSQKARVYTLLIFRLDHNDQSEPLFAEGPGIVYGERRLIAKYAVTRTGRKSMIELLPKCDVVQRRSGRKPMRVPSSTSTVHRVRAAVDRYWNRALGVWAKLRLGIAAVRNFGKQCLKRMVAVASRLVERGAAVSEAIRFGMLVAIFRKIWARVLATAGCTAEKCDGTARNPFRNLTRVFKFGEVMTGARNRVFDWRNAGLRNSTASRMKTEGSQEFTDVSSKNIILIIKCGVENDVSRVHGIRSVEDIGSNEPGSLPGEAWSWATPTMTDLHDKTATIPRPDRLTGGKGRSILTGDGSRHDK